MSIASGTSSTSHHTQPCPEIAIVGGTRYPCRSHEGGVHHFTADLPDPCPAPFCRLPAGHRTLHDIPPGRPMFATAGGWMDPPAMAGCDTTGSTQ